MNAFTHSRELLDSTRPPLTVPQMIADLHRFEHRNSVLDAAAVIARKFGNTAREDQLGDEMADLDARIALHRTAIRAAVDAALEPLGVTLAELEGLL